MSNNEKSINVVLRQQNVGNLKVVKGYIENINTGRRRGRSLNLSNMYMDTCTEVHMYTCYNNNSHFLRARLLCRKIRKTIL